MDSANSSEAVDTEYNTLQKVREIESAAIEANEAVSLATEAASRELRHSMNAFNSKLEATIDHGKVDIESAVYTGQQILAAAIEDGKREIKNIHKTSPRKEYEEHSRQSDDLLRRLKEFYVEILSHVPICPLMPNQDTLLGEYTVPPKIVLLPKRKCRRLVDKLRIYTYKDILYTTGKLNKRIFLQGEPGSGKSTFAARLILDWCGQPSRVYPEQFSDLETLNVFKFVFYIELRECMHQREVLKMIQEQIVDLLYHTGEDRNNVQRLVQNIIETEVCCVLQDGLDEWADPEGRLAVPLLSTIGNECTVLTTSRPWKLTDERIKDSQIDILLELTGIIDPYLLCKIILRCTQSDDFECKYSELISYISKSKLESLLPSPMMTSLVVCAWLDDVGVEGSVTEIYSILLDFLFKKANGKPGYFNPPQFRCLAHTRYIQPNIDLFVALSRAAFELMFSGEKETSIVFGDRELLKYVSMEEKSLALTTGILSERKSPSFTYRKSICFFLHKSIQEFMAAYHIACNLDVTSDALASYLQRNPNAYLDLSQVFIYVCGMDSVSANRLSCILDNYSIIHTSVHDCRELQCLIVSGFKECQANKQSIIDNCLKLSNFDFDYVIDPEDIDALKSILMLNMNNINSIHVTIDSVHIHDLPRILMSSAHCLEQLHLCLQGTLDEMHSSAPQHADARGKQHSIVSLPDVLCRQRKLHSLTLASISRVVDVRKWLGHPNQGWSDIESIPLPPSLACFTLTHGKCSSSWLRNVLIKMSTFKHNVKFVLDMCTINQRDASEASTLRPVSNTIDRAPSNDMSGVSLVSDVDSAGLYEAIHGTGVRRLTLKGVENTTLLSDTVPTLTKLEKLRLVLSEYIQLQLPTRLKRLMAIYESLSPSSFRRMLNQLSCLGSYVECCILFGCEAPRDEYTCTPDKQYIDQLDNVIVKSFTKGEGFYVVDDVTFHADDIEDLHFFRDAKIWFRQYIALVVEINKPH
ncbi:uncharacterized protein LOC127879054 [Dreissena polymorpha]|uniref:NACHT domain-containing protein n=1 Tax=Dreissena polymorpha TaxID=45954 RepID=A0A9D4MSD7_DREPO|nr:uncharacterized protein LOC127879054 [Dreissena polymorpha]KAH3881074.1 hypothetical protein DPMN_004998 [Dreissena polymorpha]